MSTPVEARPCTLAALKRDKRSHGSFSKPVVRTALAPRVGRFGAMQPATTACQTRFESLVRPGSRRTTEREGVDAPKRSGARRRSPVNCQHGGVYARAT